MAIGRVVQPEILDGLPPDDPEALRSRRDLRRLNAAMGNFRWVERKVGELAPAGGIVEIGAGEGVLSERLARRLPGRSITGIDLAPDPKLPDVNWRQGDLFRILPELSAEVLVGVMIVHHFSSGQLSALGGLLGNFRAVVLCEPWRSPIPKAWGGLAWPFVGKVTRHDLPASVRAGFKPGEIPAALGLEKWRIGESVDWRGSIRMVACRN